MAPLPVTASHFGETAVPSDGDPELEEEEATAPGDSPQQFQCSSGREVVTAALVSGWLVSCVSLALCLKLRRSALLQANGRHRRSGARGPWFQPGAKDLLGI
ncbi:unnamed protein product [Arctogadus glacialis]